MAKKPGVEVVKHVHQVEAVIDRHQDHVPNSFLRLGEN